MRAFLNGRILKNIIVFKNFEIDFLSEITKSFKKQTFTVDDNIFTEGDEGGTMYFIVTGLVTILHKKTQTYIRDLKQDQYFGEIEFFSQKPRFTTVKSRDFTEVLVLTYETFADVAQESYPEAFVSLSCFLYPRNRKRYWRSKTPSTEVSTSTLSFSATCVRTMITSRWSAPNSRHLASRGTSRRTSRRPRYRVSAHHHRFKQLLILV